MPENDELRREMSQLAERLARVEHILKIGASAQDAADVAAVSSAAIIMPKMAEPPESMSAAPTPIDLIMPEVAEPSTPVVSSASSRAAPPPLSPPTTPVPVVPPTEDISVESIDEATIQSRTKADAFHRLSGQAPVPSSPATSAPTAVPSPRKSAQTMTPSDRAMGKRGGTPLELLIGGKALAWIGAITVLLAAAFAVMVGVQRGWWGHMSPSMRCLFIALFGVALLAGGEITLRRIGRAASVGLFGAGLGTLYLDSFATFRFFEILPREWAFVLMAVTAVIGFAITWRTKFLSIGVLSITAGYLTPVLLRGQSGHDIELLGYLSMLLGISLGLSTMEPRSFRPLRYVALAAHGLLACLWLISNSTQWAAAMVFMSLWWAMMLAETVLAAMRRQSAKGNVVAMIVATAMFVTGGCWVLNGASVAVSAWLGAFACMIAVLCAAAAVVFGPGLDGLRNAPLLPIDKLAMALWAQAGVLLTVAVALQFDGFGQSIGWMAIGLAAIEVGRRLPSRGVTRFALIVGALALARIAIVDWWPGTMRTPLWELGDVTINRWSILALAGVAATHIAAQRIRPKSPDGRGVSPIVLAVIATLLWMGVWAAQSKGIAQTGGWLLGATALLALEPQGRRQRYFEIALLALTATAARWLIVDGIGARLDPRWASSARLPVLNWQMGMAAAIAAVGWWAYRIAQRRQRKLTTERPLLTERGGAGRQWVIVAGAVFGLIALSFETDRTVMFMAGAGKNIWWSIGHVRQLMLTLLWAMGSTGIGLLACSMRRTDAEGRITIPRVLGRFAWSVLAACVVKWMVVDTIGWALTARHSTITGSLPIANVQMLVGAVLSVSALLLAAMSGRLHSDRPANADDSSWFTFAWRNPASLIPAAAAVVILWGLSFEVDRALARLGDTAPAWLAAWPAMQVRALLWTILWAVGGSAMMAIGRWRKMEGMIPIGWMILVGAAVAWLTFDTLTWRLANDAVSVTTVFNVQFMAGATCAALLAWAVMSLRRSSATDGNHPAKDVHVAIQWSLGLIVAIGWLLGSLEIDRTFADDAMRLHTGLSIFWGLYATMLIVVGFMRRATAARYAGLGLLGVTLVKVFVIDMKAVDWFWRAVIFAVVGLLLIGVSIVYGKLAPRFFAASDDGAADG